MALRIYLGTHQPQWLARLSVPLFVSRRTLAGRKSLPRALGRWALDSGGFSELQMFGRWETTPEQYVAEVRRFMKEIGNLDWAAIQDWMCEPQVINGLVRRRNPKAKRPPAIDLAAWKRWVRGLMREGRAPRGLVATYVQAMRLGSEAEIVFHGTGLSVEEHQRRSVASALRLRELAPEVPWTPVLQGWEPEDYFRHVEMYRAAGVDLWAVPVVGVGSVCRRQHTEEAEGFLRRLAALGLRLHGFGFKALGLERVHDVLQSSDSLAWSFAARRRPPLPDCVAVGEKHKNCANCARFALRWLDHLHARLPVKGRPHTQLSLFPDITRRAA